MMVAKMAVLPKKELCKSVVDTTVKECKGNTVKEIEKEMD